MFLELLFFVKLLFSRCYTNITIHFGGLAAIFTVADTSSTMELLGGKQKLLNDLGASILSTKQPS